VSVAALAAAAYAEIGSVISSFYFSGFTYPYAHAIYRDASYVYGVFIVDYPGGPYLRRYTTAGSLIDSVGLGLGLTVDADHAHLGAAHMSIINYGNHRLHIVNKSTGSTVGSFHVVGPGIGSESYAWDVMWDGAYYYVSGYGGRSFNRYTSSGSLVGSWTAYGWPAGMLCHGVAFAPFANNRAGNYLVASDGGLSGKNCIVDMNNGSLVSTWTLTGKCGTGAVYGPSSRPRVFRRP